MKDIRVYSRWLIVLVLLLLAAAALSSSASAELTDARPAGPEPQLEGLLEDVYLPAPQGYLHRPLVEIFTGLSCPACMDGPHQDMELLAEEGKTEQMPYHTIVFHQLNGGGVDDLATDETKARMRHYQPGVSGTPDAEFDGGYIELGGITSPGGSINYQNGKDAVESCKTRYDNINFVNPFRSRLDPFKFVNVEVADIYQGDSVGVTVDITYLATNSLLFRPSLNAEVFVFIVEDNVTAYSKVTGEYEVNNGVFRGYAIEGEQIDMSIGDTINIAGGWDIPADAPVPVKPQDLYAVAAVFDLSDTDSQDNTKGNKADVPRCIQSASSRSTAFDLENKPPVIHSITASEAGSEISVSADIIDEEGLLSAFIIYSTDATGLNWTYSEMELTGQELCDDSGACYAYGSGMATGTFQAPDDWPGTYFVLATDAYGLVKISPVQTYNMASVPGEGRGPVGLGMSIVPIILVICAAGLTISVIILYRRKQAGHRVNASNPMVWVIGILLVVLIILSLIYVSGMFSSANAPDFEVKTTKGGTLRLSDYRGRVVLLDIMSTTCTSCEEAMDVLTDIYPEYGDDVVFISVSVDKKDTMDILRSYASSHGAKWTFAQDNADSDVYKKYGVSQIPRILIIDSEGKVTYDKLGAPSKAELTGMLDDTLANEASPITINTFTGTVGLIALAVFAGVGMFFSPCAFPLLPSYISYTINKSDKEKGGVKSGVKIGIIAASGLVLFFMIIGLIVSFAGQAVSKYFIYLELVIGVALIALGIILFFQIPIPVHYVTTPVKRLFKRGGEGQVGAQETSQKDGKMGFFMYGVGYAGGVASCTMPILLGLVMIGLGAGGFLGSVLMFVIFSVSMAALMIFFTVLATVGGQAVFAKYKRAMKYIERGSAVVLVVVGLYYLLNYLSLLPF